MGAGRMAMTEEAKSWLRFEDRDVFLSAADVDCSVAVSISKREISSGQTFYDAEGLFVPVRQRNRMLMGLLPFFSKTLDRYNFGPVMEERFVFDLNGGTPKLMVSFLYESGLTAYMGTKFYTNGDHQDSLVVYERDESTLVMRRRASYVKDCCFCDSRGEPCSCSDDMKKRCAPDLTSKSLKVLKDESNVAALAQYFQQFFHVSSQSARVDVIESEGNEIQKPQYSFRIEGFNRIYTGGPLATLLREKFVQKHTMRRLPPTAGPRIARISSILEKQKCPQCPSEFSRRCDLGRHIRVVHEGIRQHKCAVCGYSFAQQSHLREHVDSVHEQRKEHHCSTCSASFSVQRKLKRHVREVHNKERRKRCWECGKAYVHHIDLKRHLATVHDVKFEAGEEQTRPAVSCN